MFKSKLLFAILASTFTFAGCAKDDKTADNAAKIAEPATADTVVAEDQPAAPVLPDTAEPTAPGEDELTAPVTDDANREVVAEQAIVMFAELSEIVKATKDDCPKMATDVKVFLEKSKPVLEASKQFQNSPEDKKWFDDTYGEKVEVTMNDMMGNMSVCMKDPAVQAAFEGLAN